MKILSFTVLMTFFASNALAAFFPSCISQRRISKEVYSCLATGRIYSDQDFQPYMINDFGACIVNNDTRPEGGRFGQWDWFGMKMELSYNGRDPGHVRLSSRGPGVPQIQKNIESLPKGLHLASSYVSPIDRSEWVDLTVDCYLMPPLPTNSKEVESSPEESFKLDL